MRKEAAPTDGETAYVGMVYFDGNNTLHPVKFRFGTRVGRDEGYEYAAVATDTTFTYNSSITIYNRRGNTTASGFETTDSTVNYGDKYVLIGDTYYKLTSASHRISSTDTRTYYYYTITGYSGTSNFTSDICNYQYVPAGIAMSDSFTGIQKNYDGLSASDVAENNDPTSTDSSYKSYHIVGADYMNDYATAMSFKGGEYAAVGIVPSDSGPVGVVAWYDAKAKKLVYSYNTKPGSPVVGGAWQTNAMYIDSTKYTGWHVDMCVDADGGIHIAYYNSARGDLKYAYLSSYDDTKPDVVTVDSYLSVGTNITIKTRSEGGKIVPYILYYNASANQTMSSIKVAWRNDMTTLRDGAINDKFTGAWESMTIPTENIPKDGTVCGGVPTSGQFADKVVLGYMSDAYYEKAVLKK